MNTTSRHRFGFFDPKQEYSVTYGQLPHWEQEGATTFITFRTADSLPSSVIDLWLRARADWLRRLGIEPEQADWCRHLSRFPHTIQRQFHREFGRIIERRLDELHGKCELRAPELANVVAESLLYFDTVRYDLGGFVVMPNHVHVLVCFRPGIRLRKQCQSWKHFTARKINEILGKSGPFWQTESFDHLVRDADNFNHFRKYLAENPQRANLRAGEYVLYLPDLASR